MSSQNPPTEPNQTPVSQLSYEQAFSELEAIVAILETDKRTLEERSPISYPSLNP